MVNGIIIGSTNFLGQFLRLFRLDKQFRNKQDLRLVFYHGIGERNAAAMTYLRDEIPLDDFRAHIDYLQQSYQLVSLKDAVNQNLTGKPAGDKPLATISFDDGLYSVYRDAYPLLRERGIPFDVFINTSVVGNQGLLWLHAINYLLTSYGAQDVASTINSLADRQLPDVPADPAAIETWCRDNFNYLHESSLVDRLFTHYKLDKTEVAKSQGLYLGWEHINEMSENDVGFYSHTHSHYPLNAIESQDAVKHEIQVAYDIIQAEGRSNEFVSFPFGMQVDYGKGSLPLAFSAGHDYVVEVGSGLNSAERIAKQKILSRVSLGDNDANHARLYAAIELVPLIKVFLKRLVQSGM